MIFTSIIAVIWIAAALLTLVLCQAAQRADIAQATGSAPDANRVRSPSLLEHTSTSTCTHMLLSDTGGEYSDVAA
jgi:hypothetical protein